MPAAASEGFALGGEHPLLLLLAGVALFAGVVALTREHERPFSSASVYLLVGGLISVALRAADLTVFDPLTDPQLLERLTEVGVIIALFAAGLRLDRRLTWRGWRTPAVLLIVVMPVTIALVALWGALAMGLSAGAAILLGAVLAPTDPVLAKDVSVGPPGEDREPEPRFALTAEAGLNDGLAFPFVFLGLFVAGDEQGWFAEWLSADVLYAITVGLAAGAVGGRLIAMVVVRLRGTEWLTSELDGWIAVGATLIVYGATELIGAYGFLAAFTAGLAFRRSHGEDDLSEGAHHGIETVENVSELALVLLIGTTVTAAGLGQPGLSGWLLVPLLLLLIRPVTTIAALAPLRLPLLERAFIGWFGIRGIGSLYYVAVALGAGVLTMDEATTLYWTVIVCVGVSVIVHGISASPLTREVVDDLEDSGRSPA
jgi:NhaP-type Na+/H+ or K+/H+ antiporter